MQLINGNLVIRSADAADAQTLCDWWNDGAIMAHAGFPLGLGTTAEEIKISLQRDTSSNRRMMLEIDGEPAGEMSYRITSGEAAEIGIKICRVCKQNQGYGSACLNMLIGFLFEELGVDKIILDTNLKNYRAQHVYEKIGFEQIAVHHDSWRNQLGELQSSVDYELTRDHYSEIRFRQKPVSSL